MTTGSTPPPAGDNQLARMGLPTFFEVGDLDGMALVPPPDRHGQSVRVWARSLSDMQKEAVVFSPAAGRAWRLASDEGPYLHGFDAAPCPLAFLSTGMVASFMNEMLALARQRRIGISNLVLVQDNFYTMEGSALQGTMTGGALPVDLAVHVTANAGGAALDDTGSRKSGRSCSVPAGRRSGPAENRAHRRRRSRAGRGVVHRGRHRRSTNWGATPRSCAGTWRATTSSRMSFCRRAGQRAARDGPAPSIRSRPPSS